MTPWRQMAQICLGFTITAVLFTLAACFSEGHWFTAWAFLAVFFFWLASAAQECARKARAKEEAKQQEWEKEHGL